MSQHKACQASGLARSSVRYRLAHRDDSGVIAFIEQHMAANPKHGFGLLHDSARFQGQPWGKSVLWRVYRAMNLNLPRRGKKRLPERIKQPLQAAPQPNQGWSCDFMSDALWFGRRFRTFNVLDEYNREGLRIEVDTSLPATRVIRALDELVEIRGRRRSAWTTTPSSSPRCWPTGRPPKASPWCIPARQAHAERLHQALQPSLPHGGAGLLRL